MWNIDFYYFFKEGKTFPSFHPCGQYTCSQVFLTNASPLMHVVDILFQNN